MAHCNTIFSQILRFVPRHEFEALANRHHSGQAFHTHPGGRSLSPWRWHSYPAVTACAISLIV